ncbi:hypothetical protein G6O69_26010 [Pseudenhygromyxa sp. WMMC2535]|uniref:hypothetical protein n=1 Tax=Pseudenhygromyxa sp. WMMC2535 TaxID=2712867 RepID=UPI0015536CD7|nr:hypothetical protein [Pseudenhygromyxa sp. WMMC2535]NVB41319.1 hypothetical protein [Pseudenhygromyxa sp. WMMC2535]
MSLNTLFALRSHLALCLIFSVTGCGDSFGDDELGQGSEGASEDTDEVGSSGNEEESGGGSQDESSGDQDESSGDQDESSGDQDGSSGDQDGSSEAESGSSETEVESGSSETEVESGSSGVEGESGSGEEESTEESTDDHSGGSTDDHGESSTDGHEDSGGAFIPVPERLVLSSASGARAWVDPALSDVFVPDPDLSFGTSVFLDSVVVGQRVFTADLNGGLRIFEPLEALEDGAAPSVVVPSGAVYDGWISERTTMRSDTGGGLWMVTEAGMVHFEDAGEIDAGSVADALLEIPSGLAVLGAIHEGSDRAFVASGSQLWIWEQASTRVGIDADFDESLPLIYANDLIVAGDKLVISQFGEPKLAIYDAETVSAGNPEPEATLDGLFNPGGLYSWKDLLFIIDSGVIRIHDIDNLGLANNILYAAEGEPAELIYSSSHVLYVRFADEVEVWSSVPDEPAKTQLLSAESEALGMALEECFSDENCEFGQCVAGVCR